MMATQARQTGPEEATQSDLWTGAVFVREAIIDDVHGWAVFDADGDVIFHDEMRCKAWFFVTNNDLRVLPRH